MLDLKIEYKGSDMLARTFAFVLNLLIRVVFPYITASQLIKPNARRNDVSRRSAKIESLWNHEWQS